MIDVAVIVPVLGRPAAARPLAASLRASEQTASLLLVWVCSPDDDDQIRACSDTLGGRDELLIAPWPRIRGDYARKIHLGVWETVTEYVFTGADDLEFTPGWADAAIAAAVEHDVCVVGTNDLANPSVTSGAHATHSLVRRTYIEECGTIDTPGLLLHEGYHHVFCDNELVETAKYRDCWAFAKDAVVKHRHPIYDRTVPRDATYELGDAHHGDDRALFRARQPMWGGGR